MYCIFQGAYGEALRDGLGGRGKQLAGNGELGLKPTRSGRGGGIGGGG